MVRPFAVDVCSGVEDGLGRKDHLKVRRFIAAVRAGRGKVSSEKAGSEPNEQGFGAITAAVLWRDFDCAARRADHSVSSGPALIAIFGTNSWTTCGGIIPGDPRSASLRASQRMRRRRAPFSSSSHRRAQNQQRASARFCWPSGMGKSRRIIAETGAGQHGVATGDGVRCLTTPCVSLAWGRGRHRAPAAQRLADDVCWAPR